MKTKILSIFLLLFAVAGMTSDLEENTEKEEKDYFSETIKGFELSVEEDKLLEIFKDTDSKFSDVENTKNIILATLYLVDGDIDKMKNEVSWPCFFGESKNVIFVKDGYKIHPDPVTFCNYLNDKLQKSECKCKVECINTSYLNQHRLLQSCAKSINIQKPIIIYIKDGKKIRSQIIVGANYKKGEYLVLDLSKKNNDRIYKTSELKLRTEMDTSDSIEFIKEIVGKVKEKNDCKLIIDMEGGEILDEESKKSAIKIFEGCSGDTVYKKIMKQNCNNSFYCEKDKLDKWQGFCIIEFKE